MEETVMIKKICPLSINNSKMVNLHKTALAHAQQWTATVWTACFGFDYHWLIQSVKKKGKKNHFPFLEVYWVYGASHIFTHQSALDERRGQYNAGDCYFPQHVLAPTILG